MQTAQEPATGWSRRSKLWFATVALLVLAGACYWYGVEHQSHIAKALFWMLLLVCPLMHIFGHSNHRQGDESPRRHL